MENKKTLILNDHLNGFSKKNIMKVRNEAIQTPRPPLINEVYMLTIAEKTNKKFINKFLEGWIINRLPTPKIEA